MRLLGIEGRMAALGGLRHGKWWAAGALLVAVGVWIAFFDSHSLARRLAWGRELAQARAENAALEAGIAALEAELAEVSEDEVIEAAAREQYGMRRPGETVYRVARRKQNADEGAQGRRGALLRWGD